MTFLTGTLLTRGRRTVAAALRARGNRTAGTWSLFPPVLNRACWYPLAVPHQWLVRLVETGVPAGERRDRVSDDTRERRWGRTISIRGQERERALSSRERSVRRPGLRWIVMAGVGTLPGTPQRWAWPFVWVLATTPDVRPAGPATHDHRDVGAAEDPPGETMAP